MSYVTEIAASILSYCGDETCLGADVYAAIAEWEKQGIPTELVLASIGEAFLDIDRANDGNPPVARLKKVVLRNFTQWLAIADKNKFKS
ncbi:MAG: hypothetical protein ACKVQW_05060 [Pyrinomonadaceae bacterium]